LNLRDRKFGCTECTGEARHRLVHSLSPFRAATPAEA
jgi:hypothetical protein